MPYQTGVQNGLNIRQFTETFKIGEKHRFPTELLIKLVGQVSSSCFFVNAGIVVRHIVTVTDHLWTRSYRERSNGFMDQLNQNGLRTTTRL